MPQTPPISTAASEINSLAESSQEPLKQQPVPQESIARQFYRLTKPRVNSLIVFCAIIGMFMATPGLPPMGIVALATLGIALVAGAAAAFNCLIEQRIDASMARTRARPTVRGSISSTQIMVLASLVGGAGCAVLYWLVNPLTMWLTFATFVGYSVIYTVILKPATPQNIVIGGASGAMPPVLGWAAVAGQLSFQPWLMCLIIFLWTPPHFWALALYRVDDYAKAGLPMLPVTHGSEFTRLNIWLYTWLLVASTLLPFATGMSSWLYLILVMPLNIGFLVYAWKLYRAYSEPLAKKTFRYSIVYLTLLFAALLIDHYIRF